VTLRGARGGLAAAVLVATTSLASAAPAISHDARTTVLSFGGSF